jgi:hypothetical protein
LIAGNIRYLFPEGCDAPTIFLDPVKRAESRKKFIESLQNEANLNQQKAREAENERKLKNNERNAAALLANAALRQTTSAPKTADDSQLGTADLNSPVEVVSRSNDAKAGELFNGKDGKDLGSDGLKTGKISGSIDDNFLSDAPAKNNDNDQGRCGCDSDKMKIILPRSDVDSCSASRMAKIAIPIAADKLSAVPMRELMDLSSAKSTMGMLQNLQNLCQKYNL